MPDTTTKKKILVKIDRTLKTQLNKMASAACLNRDAYLDRVFNAEADLIEREIPVANSNLAKGHLKRELQQALDLMPVNLNLSADTEEKIRMACKSRNIPRDCFINRVIYTLLAAGRPKVIETQLGVPVYDTWTKLDFGDQTWGADFLPLVGSLHIIHDNVVAPSAFWAIRKCLDHWNREIKNPSEMTTLLGALFFLKVGDKTITALNCFIDDQFVPGTKKNRELVAADKLLLDELIL